MPVSPARRRGVSARKRAWSRYENQSRAARQVSPSAVELAEQRIEAIYKLNRARRRAIFHAVQLLSRYDRKGGARLPQRAFSSDGIGQFIQRAIVESGLAKCPDWHSWKPTNRDFRNAKPRAFIPCWELTWADTGLEVVSSFANYCGGRYDLRASLHGETRLVCPHSGSGVELAPSIVRSLEFGTGLYCDFDVLKTLLLGLEEDERSRKLGAALASVGRMQMDELRPVWTQHEWGRLYCAKPACINMPTVLLPALRSIEGLPIWNVDFSSFELRIACNLVGQKLRVRDAYREIADRCALTRERVKMVINPMLHGQTAQQVWYARESSPDLKRDRPLVEKEMARALPQLFASLNSLRRDDSVLQRRGARVFFHCMGRAIERCEIKTGGLPKHDGWLFAATESQAKAVSDIFASAASEITNSDFPVKLEAVVEPKS